MQNCPLETTKIASVMDLNAQNCRIYTLQNSHQTVKMTYIVVPLV